MSNYRRGEYDNYKYPEVIEKETEDTKIELAKAKARIRTAAERIHNKAKERGASTQ